MDKEIDKEITYEILPEDHPNYDLAFKIIVIGDSFTGKTCLSAKALKDQFQIDYSATIGFEFLSTNIKFNDKICKLQVWDTCGQEIYRSLIINFYRSASLAILVFSIDNRESFENLSIWLKEVKTNCNPDIKIILCATKADLEGKRTVSKEEAERFKSEYELNFYIETSSKTGLNAKEVFIEAGKCLYREFLLKKIEAMSKSNSNYSGSLYKSFGTKKENKENSNGKENLVMQFEMENENKKSDCAC